ncbi:hypothetical protein [Nodularia spumigena]|uniref:hypothetical protein n=1 Tax=Nodularia spumigena TaxID=70799 RepID=UPI002B20A333|nr:hypothetical protein [Nodularia spumigena]MEA5614842.1 hypothetical protein [Nodularia spumigena UHCC 0040]
MLTASMLALSFVAVGPTPVTSVRPAAEIIELRAGMVRPADQIRRDQVRFNAGEKTEVVAVMQDGALAWSADSDRARLGGHDAAELILVRAFDAVFAIDPFAAVPAGGAGLWRQLTRETSLETDRTLFNRQGIDRTEELSRLLENARQNWLRDNGFYAPQTDTNGSTGQPKEATLPEPAGWFQIPDDMPRTRSREQVQAAPDAGQAAFIASTLLSGDEPVRISLPFGTAPDVVASVERRNAEAARVAKR